MLIKKISAPLATLCLLSLSSCSLLAAKEHYNPDETYSPQDNTTERRAEEISARNKRADYKRARLAQIHSSTRTQRPSYLSQSKAREDTEIEQSIDRLDEYGKNWLYGPGMGKTMANVGTSILFPPYGFYVLGNAGLCLMGYEELKISNALPQEAREPVLDAYNGITSVPGRITAEVVGEEYREVEEENEQK